MTLRQANGADTYYGANRFSERLRCQRSRETDAAAVQRRASECRNRAERRARQGVRWAVYGIEADHLLTLTYRENMVDVERAKRDWDGFRRAVDKHCPEWPYVLTMEFQERGAIHFHVAVKGRQDVKMLRACWWGVVGEGQGNIDVRGPARRWAGRAARWSRGKLARYLSKYLSKSFDALPVGAKRYWASADRARPVVSVFWLQARTPQGAFEQAYEIAAGGRAIGVRQWISPGGDLYWIESERPPLPPF